MNMGESARELIEVCKGAKTVKCWVLWVLGKSGNFPNYVHHLAARGLPPGASTKKMTLCGCRGAVLGLERSFEVNFALCESKVEIGWLWHEEK